MTPILKPLSVTLKLQVAGRANHARPVRGRHKERGRDRFRHERESAWRRRVGQQWLVTQGRKPGRERRQKDSKEEWFLTAVVHGWCPVRGKRVMICALPRKATDPRGLCQSKI